MLQRPARPPVRWVSRPIDPTERPKTTPPLRPRLCNTSQAGYLSRSEEVRAHSRQVNARIKVGDSRYSILDSRYMMLDAGCHRKGSHSTNGILASPKSSKNSPQITQIDADDISKVRVFICVICVICGQIWAGGRIRFAARIGGRRRRWPGRGSHGCSAGR